MKKSLKVIASAAMAFSMFASVAMAADATTPAATTTAAAKTSADFKDLANIDAGLKAKIDAMLKAGIFEGTAADSFGINENMTRAQAAKILDLIYNVKVDATVKTSSFADVKADHWALSFIEAAKKAGYIDGKSDTSFDPEGKVTLGEFATMLLKGLGVKPDVTGNPWYADAVKQAIAKNLIPAGSDGSKAASRSALVVGAYIGQQAAIAQNKPAAYAVNEVKAVGASKLAVTLNGAGVDTTKITFAVTRDSSPASFDATKVTWNDSKTTATITLDSKLIAATYAVTIGGVTVDDAKKTGSVVATAEKLSKIEILTASDILPQANKVKVEFKASNQYGEVSTKNASNFTITSGDLTPVSVSGEQAFTLDLVGATPATPIKKKDDKVAVTIIDTDSGVQANKIYTVGETPKVAKIEIGDLKDASNNTITSVEAGKNFFLSYTAYDQYGIKVEDKTVLNNSGTGVTVVIPDNDIIKGEKSDSTNTAFVDSVIGTNAPDLEMNTKSTASVKDVNVTLYANYTGQNVSKKISISTPKVPASVEFGSFTTALAENDVNVYLPLVIKDASGALLSNQDIADKADKFTVFPMGGLADLSTGIPAGDVINSIQQTGADKGKIRIGKVNKGSGQIVIQLKDNPNVKATLSLSAGEDRKADSIKVSDAGSDKMLYGTSNEVKFKTYDQYGGDLKDKRSSYATNYKVAYELSDPNAVIVGVQNEVQVGSPAANKYGAVTAGTYQVIDLVDAFDKKMTFTSKSGVDGTAKLTARLLKVDPAGTLTYGSTKYTEVANTSKTVQVYSGQDSTTSFNYSAFLDGGKDNTIVAVDKMFDSTNPIGGGALTAPAVTASSATYAKLGKLIKISATDKDGSKVALNQSDIQSINSSNPSVVNVDNTSKYIAGRKAGTSVVTVVFNTPKGAQTAQLTVTVKEEGLNLTDIASDKAANTISASVLDAANAWKDKLMNKLTTHDQYGGEYINENTTTTQNITKYSDALNLVYSISNVKYSTDVVANQDYIYIDPKTGVIKYKQHDQSTNVVAASRTVKSFTINVTTPTGKTASADISVDAN